MLDKMPVDRRRPFGQGHRSRLGLDLRALVASQELLIAAVQDHDTAAARQSLRMLSVIKIPFFEDDQDAESA